MENAMAEGITRTPDTAYRAMSHVLAGLVGKGGRLESEIL